MTNCRIITTCKKLLNCTWRLHFDGSLQAAGGELVVLLPLVHLRLLTGEELGGAVIAGQGQTTNVQLLSANSGTDCSAQSHRRSAAHLSHALSST